MLLLYSFVLFELLNSVQTQVGEYVPSAHTILPTFVSQCETPPCQEQQPLVAYALLNNTIRIVNKTQLLNILFPKFD